MPKLAVPHSLVIVFALLLLAVAATLVLPGGSYEREKHPDGSETVVQGSFQVQPRHPQLLQFFTAPMKGFRKLWDIIAFIFFIGGAFNIIAKTGAIDAGIARLVRAIGRRRRTVVALVMVAFSFFGAFFGMCEEAMPFVLIFVPLALSLGYDSITGLCLSFLAAGVGFATAFFNPFTVQIAQRLAGVPLLSGWEYRVGIWAGVTALTIAWVLRHAERVRKDPASSPTYAIDRARKAVAPAAQGAALGWRNALILCLLAAAVGVLFAGVLAWEWYITELSALFVALGLASGITAGMTPNALAREFAAGAKDMVGACLVVAFAAGILVLLEDGRVIDTILYGAAQAFGALPPLLAAYAQYAVQAAVNFVIPSGTTKAALTMPLMAPLADLTGITRQTAVLAYQFGDGFTNMIIPTSAVTVGTLELAGVPFEKWFRWLLPLQIVFILLSLLLLVPPVLMGW